MQEPTSKESKIKEYAELTIQVGANVQKGQTLVINAQLACAKFVRALAQAAYDAGAREVVVRWSDDAMTRMTYLRADESVFAQMPDWQERQYYEYAEMQAALISVSASDPMNLRGVDPSRIQSFTRTAGQKLARYQDMMMSNYFPWCVVAYPNAAWAKTVYPNLGSEEGMELLFDDICQAIGVGGDGGSVARWQEKIELMGQTSKKLNDLRIKTLYYENSLGTSLSVDLAYNHEWTAVGERCQAGHVFAANIPSEEIFTLPDRFGTNGVVYASKPLVLNGNLVDDIFFRFEKGQIVEAHAGQGSDILSSTLEVDEGARYLGEVALVGHNSPISLMDKLFYNTLFDENASCHFAFGRAYPTFRDARQASAQTLRERGMNESMVHVDFMVGTPDLTVSALCEDGSTVTVMKDGNFAI